MAHEIEGNSAFFTRKPAWHKLGTVLQDAPSLEDAWRIAYPHELFKLQLQAVLPTDDGTILTQAIDNHCAIIRSDGKEIGCVGKDFEIVQPWQAMQVFEPILSSGLATLESGGSLRDGKRMWGLAKIVGSDTEIVKGDVVKAYLLMATGFDGSLSHIIKATNTRVVCNNTLSQALGTNSNSGYKFKHTKSIHSKLINATSAIHETLSQFKKDCEAYKVLAEKKVNDSQIKTYIRNVLCTKEELSGDKEISSRKENTIDDVYRITMNQRSLEYVPAVRGTAWQAYNGVTEYLTHTYGNTDDSRLDSQWFGASASLNTHALNLALTM
jgi:phage/plasmid-like protein (TIGR03299 family)